MKEEDEEDKEEDKEEVVEQNISLSSPSLSLLTLHLSLSRFSLDDTKNNTTETKELIKCFFVPFFSLPVLVETTNFLFRVLNPTCFYGPFFPSFLAKVRERDREREIREVCAENKERRRRCPPFC